jgi:nucleoside-diphosphate-sugar epimerase
MSTYLITGGAGFIGSHLGDALIAAGHDVRVLDNLSSGSKDKMNPKVTFYEKDVTDLESIRPCFEGVDGVFHMAAIPSVPYSVEDPLHSTEVNLMATLKVLIAARDAKVKRLVYSASAAAYGSDAPCPQSPEFRPDPQSPYAIQKIAGEFFVQQFAALYGIETVSLRYFNVYGPRMNDQGAYVPVFMHFLRQKKAGKVLSIFGDGEQTRDFVHVSDVVQANICAMLSSTVGKGEVLNVGVGERTSINRIAEIMGGLVEHLPARTGDVRQSQADISLTRKLLAWEPRIHFEDGFQNFLDASSDS